VAEGETEVGSDGPLSLDEGVAVDERRQVLSAELELLDLLEHFGRKCLLLLFEAIEVDFEERLLEVAAKVADGLHLSSEVVVDEGEGGLRIVLFFALHSTYLHLLLW
jgi:hypothetical protein